MRYISTRSAHAQPNSADAILQGISPDGGLFVPESIPTLALEEIGRMAALSYEEIAFVVMREFLADYGEAALRDCIHRAYGGGKFDAPQTTPLVKLEDGLFVLELWHGPTCAFKDMALQLLPQLIQKAMEAKGKEGDAAVAAKGDAAKPEASALAKVPGIDVANSEANVPPQRDMAILVATSGDTGKAALDGFMDVAGTKIIVFYPRDGISQVQKQQMVTQKGGNVHVVGVNGNFDDAQTGVKKIFANQAIRDDAAQAGYEFSSANSINWGRLAPQIVYYFAAYAGLLRTGEIRLGQPVDFVVPTGNFGDILAGFYAKRMGLPVGRLVCASNENHILTDFIATGVYDLNRAFRVTLSPAMDILISSNLERLLFELCGRDAAVIDGWMQDQKSQKSFQIDAETHGRILEIFAADYADEAEILAEIRRVYERYHYVMDPHTAVGSAVHGKLTQGDTASGHGKLTQSEEAIVQGAPAQSGTATMQGNPGPSGAPTVLVSTASPFKFNRDVARAILGEAAIQDKNEFELLDQLSAHCSWKIPKGLQKLDKLPVLHQGVCETDGLEQAVRDVLIQKSSSDMRQDVPV